MLYGPGGDLEDLSGGGPASESGVPADRQVLWRPLLDAERGRRDPFLPGGGPVLRRDRLEAPRRKIPASHIKPGPIGPEFLAARPLAQMNPFLYTERVVIGPFSSSISPSGIPKGSSRSWG